MKIRTSRKGSTFLITLLVIGSLTALALSFAQESIVEYSLASYEKDSMASYQIAYSAVFLALAVLDMEKRTEGAETPENGGSREVKAALEQLKTEFDFSWKAVDEGGKLNINLLLNTDGGVNEERKTQILRLFHFLGIKEEALDAVLDWIDRDDEPRTYGAESAYYEDLVNPYSCGNGPFITTRQIHMVKGFEGNSNISDFLTIYSDGKVNINTAPAEVLISLHEALDDSTAKAIIRYRKNELFKATEDLKKLPGIDDGLFAAIQPWICVKGNTYSIEAEGRCGEASSRIVAVASGGDKRPQFLYWRTL